MTPPLFYYRRIALKFFHTMSIGDNPVPKSITFMIDGRIGVLDEQSIAQASGIPLKMPEGDGFEEWEYVGARTTIEAFAEAKRGLLYRRELSPVLDLVDHVIKFNVFQFGH